MIPKYNLITRKNFGISILIVKTKIHRIIFVVRSHFYCHFRDVKRPITTDNIGHFGQLSVSADNDYCRIGRSQDVVYFHLLILLQDYVKLRYLNNDNVAL